MEKDIKLHHTDRTFHLPILKGTFENKVIDVRTLPQESGLFTYDPGFSVTASCRSNITYVDGEKGLLLYRGYPIEQLVEKSNFLEIAYLLIQGELPTALQKEEFGSSLAHHSLLHEQLHFFYRGFRRDAPPMAIMIGVVGALSAFYHDSLDIHDPAHRHTAIHRLLAKIPTIAAMAYKYSLGQPFIYPLHALGYVENFLHMLFSTPCAPYIVNPLFIKVLEKFFIMHADHEQNASTSTVRLVGSSGANPFACIAAGISTLWGPAHGGANESVLEMFQDIGEPSRIPSFIQRVKDKKVRLMGFGHRIYKTYDPRARIMQSLCGEILAYIGRANDPLLSLAQELEHTALEDDYFIEKGLFPNIDFYSGIMLRAMGIPSNMFTALFAIARTAGWLAHWLEMIEDPSRRIGRPQQLYTGPERRDYPQFSQGGPKK